MDNGARRAVVATLLRLANSADYRDRADAGQAMAIFAEMPERAVTDHWFDLCVESGWRSF